eukprot:PhF_6_TR22272/c0_g1_i1/m.31495
MLWLRHPLSDCSTNNTSPRYHRPTNDYLNSYDNITTYYDSTSHDNSTTYYNSTTYHELTYYHEPTYNQYPCADTQGDGPNCPTYVPTTLHTASWVCRVSAP